VGELLSGDGFPSRFLFCGLCASLLVLRLVSCGRVVCMRVTGLGVLCAFWM